MEPNIILEKVGPYLEDENQKMNLIFPSMKNILVMRKTLNRLFVPYWNLFRMTVKSLLVSI